MSKVGYTSIPPAALKIVAECLAKGEEKYSKTNHLSIPVDEHLDHALGHGFSFYDSEPNDHLPQYSSMVNHLASVAARAILALDVYLRQEHFNGEDDGVVDLDKLGAELDTDKIHKAQLEALDFTNKRNQMQQAADKQARLNAQEQLRQYYAVFGNEEDNVPVYIGAMPDYWDTEAQLHIDRDHYDKGL